MSRAQSGARFHGKGHDAYVQEQENPPDALSLIHIYFVPFHMEPAYGSAMTQETLVSVQKVGE